MRADLGVRPEPLPGMTHSPSSVPRRKSSPLEYSQQIAACVDVDIVSIRAESSVSESSKLFKSSTRDIQIVCGCLAVEASARRDSCNSAREAYP